MPFSTYLREHMGTATLSPPGPFVAGTPPGRSSAGVRRR